MGWFSNQIKTRISNDRDNFENSFLNLSSVVMGRSVLAAAMKDDRQKAQDAIEDILTYYHVKKTELPDSVTEIGTAAFYACYALEEIILTEKSELTSIGDTAFQNCVALKSFVAPDKLTVIGKSAFEACAALESVRFTTKLEEIKDYAFRGDALLVITIVYFEAGEDETATDGFGTYWNTDNNEVLYELYVAPEVPEVTE